MGNKSLVIGLDCGTFRLIKPYIADGHLPNLGKLMDHGVFGILKSTIPPISPPAWTTFLTGKNPGRHGIFQFFELDVSNYSFSSNRLINSNLFSGATFIDVISRQGLKVGVVKIPFTYPPWKVNGFMVAGEPSPDWRKAHTYPKELAEKLGQVNLGSSTDFIRYDTDQLFEHLAYDCKARTRITCEMMEKDSFDFFMIVHSAPDAAAHRFWKFTDKACPNYEEKNEKYKYIIRDVYDEVDKSIGEILERADPDTDIFVMSDHGASRKPLHYFHINGWLKERGYLDSDEGGALFQKVYRALTFIKNSLPPSLRQLIFQTIQMRFQKRLARFQSRAASFTWDRTKAYAVNLYTTIDGIALNIKGRQPSGIVTPGREAEQLCREIQTTLLAVQDSRNGKPVIKNVYRREEVFVGPFSKKMPELIIEYDPDYRSGRNTSRPFFTDVPSSDFDFQSGDHDEDGIFIAAGPSIKGGEKLAPAGIQDLAPTILYAMGLPVPADMDGKVLLEIFKPEFLDGHALSNGDASERHSGRETDADVKLTEEEEAQMKQQLKALGYL